MSRIAGIRTNAPVALPVRRNKTTCRLCPVHCHKAGDEERMQEVMRYAGPRMLLYHPAQRAGIYGKSVYASIFHQTFRVPCQEQHKR